MMSWMYIMTMSLMILMSIMMTISMNNPLPMWFAMELNTSAIIPILAMNNKKNKGMAMKYQIINSFAALIFMFTTMNMNMMMNKMNLMYMLMMLSMIMKLGMFPFMFWFISIMKNMNWYSIMLLSSIQKIIPLMILTWMELKMNFLMMNIIIIMNVTITAINTLTSNNIKIIMAFSSISYTSWIMMIMMYSNTYWMLIMFIYTMNMMLLTKMMSKKKMNKLMKTSKEKNMMMAFILLNIGGMPPMAGFAMKIMIIKLIMTSMSTMLFITSLIMLVSATMMLFVYMKLIISSMMKMQMTMTWKKMKNKSMMKMMMMISMITPMILMW
uniref:NADH dehydrogenase subunit 2 n=1 Tax=Austropallene halanychi TaxID=3135633 RepID=UPI0030FE85D2